jgi:hypothetical protein
MLVGSYALGFEGYWREPAISGIPAASGIYGVYACTFDARAGTVSLWRLLYLGEAANVRDRVQGHEKWPEWRRQLHTGQELCLNAAVIYGDNDRRRAEAGMIRQHQPPCNSAYRDSFPFDTTTVTTTGANALMHAVFTVRRSENALASILGGVGRGW